MQTFVSTCTAQIHQACMIWHDCVPAFDDPIELWRWWAWRATHVFCHNYNGSMDDCKLEFVVPNFSQLNGYVTSEPTTIHSLPWYVYHRWGIFGEVVYSWTVNYMRFPYPRSQASSSFTASDGKLGEAWERGYKVSVLCSLNSEGLKALTVSQHKRHRWY